MRKSLPLFVLFLLVSALLSGCTCLTLPGVNLTINVTSYSAMLYWPDYSTGKIYRSNPDGTDIEILISGLSDPRDTAVDTTTRKIYWTDSASNKVQRANLDGTDVEDLIAIAGAAATRVCGLALDLRGGKMYFTDLDRKNIQRANLDGSALEVLVVTLDNPRGLALDLSAGKMYWTSFDHSNHIDGLIRRANLDGSDIEILYTRLTRFKPNGIALDLERGYLYWNEGDYGAFSGEGKIQRSDLDGSNVVDLVTGLNNVHGLAVDRHLDAIFWTDINANSILIANLDGSNPQTLISGIGLSSPSLMDVVWHRD